MQHEIKSTQPDNWLRFGCTSLTTVFGVGLNVGTENVVEHSWQQTVAFADFWIGPNPQFGQ